jgi:lysophospholipid acyltransferase (LPLAT)-like uncharacterized protein
MAPPATRRIGPITPHEARWHQRILARLITGAVRLVSATLRWEIEDRSGVLTSATEGPLIFAIWHNRLALSIIAYRRYLSRRSGERQLAAIVSASRDGAMMSKVMGHFRVHVIRGSSSRGGLQALVALAECGRRGMDLALTPDGPRGPCYSVQAGAIALAQMTELPIVPVSYHLSRKVQLKSWDRFQVPLPFARCRVTLGERLVVARRQDEQTREDLRAELEKRMRAITEDS